MAELVVALDLPTAAEALSMARGLADSVRWMKVGLELFVAAGPDVVRRLKAEGFRVFLDLKFLDIPNTVHGAVRSAAACGADMINLHAVGGMDMAHAAVAGRDDAVREYGLAVRPKLLGVTVLTSMQDPDAPFLRGRTPLEAALELAISAHSAGLDGVVSSAREAAQIKRACGEDFICLTPGIRIPSPRASSDDQRRVATPEAAVAAGSDFLVVGRPITRAADPLAAAREILRRMEAGRPDALGRGA